MTEYCKQCELTLFEFCALSQDRELLLNFFFTHGCLKQFYNCPTCGSEKSLNPENLQYRCSTTNYCDVPEQSKKIKLKCQFKLSARIGTFFEDSHLSIEEIAQFSTYWLLVPSPRQKFIKDQLSCSNSTLVAWSSFCREICINWTIENSKKIGGHGKTVEINRAMYWNRKCNRGRLLATQYFFGAVERESSRCFLVPVEQQDSVTLLTVIEKWIEPGSTIICDCWKLYNCLSEERWVYQTVTHSKSFVNPPIELDINTTERTWYDVHGGRLPRHGGKEVHSVGYLSEFMFKRKFHNLKVRIHAFWKAVSHLYLQKDT